mgnify:CR=1 FL=1
MKISGSGPVVVKDPYALGSDLGLVHAVFAGGVRFYQPVRDLSEKYNVFQSAMVASEMGWAAGTTQWYCGVSSGIVTQSAGPGSRRT